MVRAKRGRIKLVLKIEEEKEEAIEEEKKVNQFNAWEIFQMQEFSLEEIKKHAPIFLKSDGEKNYEVIINFLFAELKRSRRMMNSHGWWG